jgi:hypothetical protein
MKNMKIKPRERPPQDYGHFQGKGPQKSCGREGMDYQNLHNLRKK